MIASFDDAPIAVDLLPDWADIAGPAGGLELEVGPGHGGFALAYCGRHPDRTLVAIEQRKKFAEDLRAKARSRGLANLLVVHGDARLLAPRLFREGALRAIHLHFPDPWWKRRHRARRLVDDGMSLVLRRLLEPGGVLDFRTDVEEVAREAAPRLEAAGFENPAGPGCFAERIPDEVLSTREKRYVAASHPVWRLRLRRPISAAAREGAPRA